MVENVQWSPQFFSEWAPTLIWKGCDWWRIRDCVCWLRLSSRFSRSRHLLFDEGNRRLHRWDVTVIGIFLQQTVFGARNMVIFRNIRKSTSVLVRIKIAGNGQGIDPERNSKLKALIYWLLLGSATSGRNAAQLEEALAAASTPNLGSWFESDPGQLHLLLHPPTHPPSGGWGIGFRPVCSAKRWLVLHVATLNM